jgi:hypothetical protein
MKGGDIGEQGFGRLERGMEGDPMERWDYDMMSAFHEEERFPLLLF